MFSQSTEPIINRAMAELASFKPFNVNNVNRDELIYSYWQYHQRFKSFKIFSSLNGHVLDVGSGPGGLYFWKEYKTPNRSDLKMTALDLEKGQHFDRYDDYVIYNLDHGDMPFKSNSFDFIILAHLIEHVTDWKSLLEKCNKVLKQDGVIYIETPSIHTINLPTCGFYKQLGFPCTTINFLDDHTHVNTVDLDKVNEYASGLGLVTLEKGYCKSPLLENTLLSYGYHKQDQEASQYGLWSKLMFSSYIILQKG